MQIYNDDLTTEYVYEWAYGTEKVVGSLMKKYGVVFSDNSRVNIKIEVVEKSGGLIEVQIMYRDSLRFTEMGAGNGYRKGKRITSQEYRNQLEKGRIRKKILMKPIFSRIGRLQSVVAAKLMQDIRTDFYKLKNA